MQNAENIARKNKVAQDYIEQIYSDEHIFESDSIQNTLNEVQNLKTEIGNIGTMFQDGNKESKSEKIEKQTLSQKTKDDLIDFLVTENFLEELKDNLILENKLSILGLKKDILIKLKNAKRVLKKDENEEEIRFLLGLKKNNVVENNESETENNPQNNIETTVVTTNTEQLKTDETFIFDQANKYGIDDPKQIAYILATVKGECGFKNIKEIGGETKSYGADGFYGRGFVQLTHKSNYKKYTEKLNNENQTFKIDTVTDFSSKPEKRLNIDPNLKKGGKIDGKNIDLIKYPDTILASNELAAFILIDGMKCGSFTGKKLSDFINNKKLDYYNARTIINGMDKANIFANQANEYLSKIEQTKNIDALKQKTKETIIVGDSHVWGFEQEKYARSTKHFDGHDTGQIYNKLLSGEVDLAGKKNLMLYVGSNDITKGLLGNMSGELTKIHNFLQKKGVNLVLCKIPYNKSKSKNKTDQVNNIVSSFGLENNLDVLDLNSGFKIDDLSYADDGIHLNKSKGYTKIGDEMLDELKKTIA